MPVDGTTTLTFEDLAKIINELKWQKAQIESAISALEIVEIDWRNGKGSVIFSKKQRKSAGRRSRPQVPEGS